MVYNIGEDNKYNLLVIDHDKKEFMVDDFSELGVWPHIDELVVFFLGGVPDFFEGFYGGDGLGLKITDDKNVVIDFDGCSIVEHTTELRFFKGEFFEFDKLSFSLKNDTVG